MSALNSRRAALLETIRECGGVWTSSRAHRLGGPNRATARGDLNALARRGLLVRHDDDRNGRYFTLPGGAA